MTQPDQRRVHDLFLQVVQLPEDEREGFLAQADEEAVVIRAVRHLLNYHQTATIISPAQRLKDTTEESSTPLTPTSEEPRTPVAPQVVSQGPTRFCLLERRRMITVVGIAFAVFCLAAYLVETTIKSQVRNQLENTMQTTLNGLTFALESWLDAEFRVYRSWSTSQELVDAVAALDTQFADSDLSTEELSKLGQPLRAILAEMPESNGDLQYAVWNRDFRLIADTDKNSPVLGNYSTDYGSQILGRVFRGESVLWAPTTDGFMTEGFTALSSPAKPGIALIVPIMGERKRPIAAMLIGGMGMQDRFEQMLEKANFGVSGEAYAIDRNGFLITESRFNDALRDAGLLPKESETPAANALRVAVPNSNIYQRTVDTRKSQEWRLTKAARMVTRGESAADFSGYPDYRGVRVVGTWAWLERFGFGVILEDDYSSAFRPMVPLRITNGALLLLTLVGFVMAMLKWRSNINHFRHLGVESRIGPYAIHKPIGEGGMARVFLATHSLLKRPTALKLLKPEQTNSRNLARFEREVQLASRLNHPNTIEIYDYGVTQQNAFYCAMEFIPGFNLQALIELDGAQLPARVVHILKGICNSLREAHSMGLVHRDIKPQNVMLCERGGEADFVKVLDFGLAREVAAEGPSATGTQVLVGTPMFIAPERIRDPNYLDPRSDIYSVGILGFILLTATQPHDSGSSLDSLLKAIQGEPKKPSSNTTHPIPPELDQLIYDCQHRDPADRPESIETIMRILNSIDGDAWQQTQAQAWWHDFSRLLPNPGPKTSAS